MGSRRKGCVQGAGSVRSWSVRSRDPPWRCDALEYRTLGMLGAQKSIYHRIQQTAHPAKFRQFRAGKTERPVVPSQHGSSTIVFGVAVLPDERHHLWTHYVGSVEISRSECTSTTHESSTTVLIHRRVVELGVHARGRRQGGIYDELE
jgi:hypothetical protein